MIREYCCQSQYSHERKHIKQSLILKNSKIQIRLCQKTCEKGPHHVSNMEEVGSWCGYVWLLVDVTADRRMNSEVSMSVCRLVD